MMKNVSSTEENRMKIVSRSLLSLSPEGNLEFMCMITTIIYMKDEDFNVVTLLP